MDRNLQNFLYVAEAGGFMAAASKHGVSQPALTKSVKKLEDLHGVKLFRRVTRGVELTDYGVTLLRAARATRNELDRVARELREMRVGNGSRIRIGCGPMWALTIVPQALEKLEERFPDLRSEVTLGEYYGLVEQLKLRQLDVVISAVGHEPEPSSDVSFRALGIATARVYAREGHPAHGQVLDNISDLRHFEWTNLLGNHNDIPHEERSWRDSVVTKLKTNSIEIALMHARKTDSIVVLPAALEGYVAQFDLRPLRLSQPVSRFPTGIHVHETVKSLPQVRHFIKEVTDWDAASQWTG